MARRKTERAPLPPMPEFSGEWTVEHGAWLVAARVRASEGDEQAADALSEAVRRQPAILERFRGMAATTEAAWIAAIAPQDIQQRWERLALQGEADHLRASLLGDAPTPLERLLVDRVVACTLATMWAESTLATRLSSANTLSLLKFYGDETDRHHRRLLKAMEALAKVRRLQVPMQVNVAIGGGKQVNVAQVAVAAGSTAAPLPEGGPISEVIDVEAAGARLEVER